jgi:hypothetical protein
MHEALHAQIASATPGIAVTGADHAVGQIRW